MQTVLKVVGIHKHYEGQALLRGVSFEVQAGEILCLLGSSGSGKSTLLRIIAGLETAEFGNILWQDRLMGDLPVHQRNFSLMFQEYALFPHMNVFSNVAFGLRMRGVSEELIGKRVKQALEMVNMSTFKNRRVTELSGGEQQRVALARALAPEPRLLMLDEPLGALDRTLKEQLCSELRTLLHRLGIPAIYVTHDQQEAFTVSDRLVILHEGRIQQQGSAEEILSHPASLWLAEFLGYTNQLRGEVITVFPLKIETSQGLFQFNNPVSNLMLGQKVTLVLKPEHAKVVRQNENGNTISGKVIDVIFNGDGYLTKIEHGTGQVVTFTSSHNHKIGSSLQVAFPPESVMCYVCRDYPDQARPFRERDMEIFRPCAARHKNRFSCRGAFQPFGPAIS
jgi:spermidine/putrescine transport system ATP-binding protein